jgi:phenylalanyl-tRNA synthetase alpha subunit
MSLEALTTEALAAIAAAQDLAALDQVRVQFTGKKSQLAEQSKALEKWILKSAKYKVLRFMLFVKQSMLL